MFLGNLFESSARQVKVIYPGRFQPFHKGHAAVFNHLCQRYGADNVFIVTSDKTDNAKSPFSFEEKKKMMVLTGVDSSKVVFSTQPYRATEIVSRFDPMSTVVLFAVSEKDMAEDPRFSFQPKKDGSPSYFQPFKNVKQCVPVGDGHAYMVTVPTFEFQVLGASANSASQIREQFSKADEDTQKKIVADLFGKFDVAVFQLMRNKLHVRENVEEEVADMVTFEIDSENAYNHVMNKFDAVIDWDNELMVAPRKYWGAIQELALAAGGNAIEAGTEDTIREDTNPQDTVTFDIPLLIRMFEYAREDAKDDMDLHNVTQKLIQMSANGDTLSMDSYNEIVSPKLQESINRRLSEMKYPMPSQIADPKERQRIASIKKLWGMFGGLDGAKRAVYLDSVGLLKATKAEKEFLYNMLDAKTGELKPRTESKVNGFYDAKASKQVAEATGLSPETLASYKKKAGVDASAADARGDFAQGNKRFKGIINATKKEFDNDAKITAMNSMKTEDDTQNPDPKIRSLAVAVGKMKEQLASLTGQPTTESKMHLGELNEARNDTIEAHGIRGMDRKPWRRSFKNVEQMEAWCEKYDAEVYGTRDTDYAAQGRLAPAITDEGIDKHSFLGRIKRHHELKGKVDQTWQDAVDAEKNGDKKAANRSFEKHVKYTNLERPGTWTKVKEEEVEEGKADNKKKYEDELKRCEHWAKNETSPQKREEYRRKAANIKNHLAKQYGQTVDEGYWDEAMKKFEKGQADRKAAFAKDPNFDKDNKNPLSHDKNGVYKGDKDLAGNPVPKKVDEAGKKGMSAHAKQVAKKKAEYEKEQDSKQAERDKTEVYNYGNAKVTKGIQEQMMKSARNGDLPTVQRLIKRLLPMADRSTQISESIDAAIRTVRRNAK